MVPWLRILPLGGVSAAVLILALALTPPHEPRQGQSPDLALARGALLDKNEHPEWPQFLTQAAFRRADEILKLRDLPDAPTLTAPIALPPERPKIAAEPLPSAPPPDAAIQSAAKALDAATAQLDIGPAPPPAASPEEKTIVPEAAPIAIAAPLPVPAPSETRVAVLPQQRPSTAPEPVVTGTLSAAADATTIPVDIGESSSDELPVVLPPERPPILRVIERRERASHVAPRKKVVRRTRAVAKPVRRPRPANVQPASEVNLFDSLFDASKSNQGAAAVAQKRGIARTTENPPYPRIDSYPFGTK